MGIEQELQEPQQEWCTLCDHTLTRDKFQQIVDCISSLNDVTVMESKYQETPFMGYIVFRCDRKKSHEITDLIQRLPGVSGTVENIGKHNGNL